MDRPTRPKPDEYDQVERVIAEYVVDLEEYATSLEGELLEEQARGSLPVRAVGAPGSVPSMFLDRRGTGGPTR